MGSIRDVGSALASAAADAISAVGITNPAQAYVGWPPDPDLITIINNVGYAVSVYPMPGGTFTPYPDQQVLNSVVDPMPLSISLATDTFTVAMNPSGAQVPAGVPIHIGINQPIADVEYTTRAGDAISDVMVGLAGVVNALALPGISATPSSNTLVIAGAGSLQGRITTTRTMLLEVGTMTQQCMQLSLWMPTSTLRQDAMEAVVSRMGSGDTSIATLADGSGLSYFLDGPPFWTDKGIQKKSLFLAHVNFLCDYSVTRRVTLTEITVASLTMHDVHHTTTASYVVDEYGDFIEIESGDLVVSDTSHTFYTREAG